MPEHSHLVTPAQRKWLPLLTAVGFFMQTLALGRGNQMRVFGHGQQPLLVVLT